MLPRCEFRMKVNSEQFAATFKVGNKYKLHRLHEKLNSPSQLKPSPISVGLQEQLYEPWVLVQDAFGWHTFILTA